ncbi:Precorrin-3B methylase [Pseudomonas syringae pv. actinidiae]|uniref:Precorrin-3B methylase n=1 Tax=Pseudomonas syringae pv. actinidiae TaxID=103796 RepID=A0A2V0QNK4_PSESF|nr:Precorrin-3B methylase [Pseudomonas syringae pv. actinidiae]
MFGAPVLLAFASMTLSRLFLTVEIVRSSNAALARVRSEIAACFQLSIIIETRTYPAYEAVRYIRGYQWPHLSIMLPAFDLVSCNRSLEEAFA